MFWNPAVCQYAGECVRGNVQVFDIKRRLWVDLTKTSADEVTAVIDRCTSGTLHYERKVRIRPLCPYANRMMSGKEEYRDIL